jgi:Uma2 family endonuclease
MSTLSTPPNRSPSKPQRRTPPLDSGDRLNHEEFIKRYAELPEGIKAERIEGVVYMAAAAVNAGYHGRPHLRLSGWLFNYLAATDGVDAADNSTIFLDTDNDPQPDLCLYIKPENGGRLQIDEESNIVGSPELVIEVAASSVSFDLGPKLNVYRRNRVSEYIVLRTYDGDLDWFILRDGEYQRMTIQADGIYRSETFPGLWLNANALIEGNLAAILATLQKGCQSPEHATFVSRLAKRI